MRRFNVTRTEANLIERALTKQIEFIDRHLHDDPEFRAEIALLSSMIRELREIRES